MTDSPEALKYALDLAGRGFYVFPIPAGEKIPFGGLKWKHTSTTDTDKIRAAAGMLRYRNCNWGIDCGKSGLTVLDIDVKTAPLDEMMKRIPDEPNSPLIVKTPSGGVHYYFTGEGKNSASKYASGVDVRGVGGYVVAPGSQNLTGVRYTPVLDLGCHAKENAEVPKWLASFMKSDASGAGGDPIHDPGADAADTGIFAPEALDADIDVDRAIKYLTEDAPEALEGNGGDETTYATACTVRDFGLSPEATLDLMLTYWNDEKAFPPWNHHELAKKVKNAFMYAENPQPGSKSLGTLFPDASGLDGTGVGSEGLIKCGRDLEVKDIKKRNWVMRYRFIAGYITLTIAPGGVGKSLLSILEGISVACGKNLTDHPVVSSGAVWMHNSEDPMDELDRRVAATAKFYGLTRNDLKDFYYSSGYEAPLKLAAYDDKHRVVINEPAVQSLIENIKRRKIKLFVIDPLVECHSLDENDNNSIAVLAQTFRRIASETNCAINLIHHANKGNKGAQGNADKARGASSLISAARIAHTLYPMTDKEAAEYGITPTDAPWFVRLDNAKANFSPPGMEMSWYRKRPLILPGLEDEPIGVLELSGIEKLQRVDESAYIRDAVASLLSPVIGGAGISLYQVANRISEIGVLPESVKTIQRRLEGLFPMEKDGVIYKIKTITNARGNISLRIVPDDKGG